MYMYICIYVIYTSIFLKTEMHLLMHSEIMGDSYFVILFWGVWVGFFFS